MKTKQDYINAYYDGIEEQRQIYIKEVGNDIDFECDDSFIDTVDEIVGYYLVRHSEAPLTTWLKNLEDSKCKWETDKGVTKVLQKLCIE